MKSSNITNKLYSATPLIESVSMSKCANTKILLKLENTQPAGSFKIRGIGNLCQKSALAGKTHFVSSSGGNAGLATAYAGKKLGIKTTVFVPQTTQAETITKIQAEGATVIIGGAIWSEANIAALECVKNDPNSVYISPFDHSDIWEGHASMIDEIAHCTQKPDAIILSVGGGGLLCGVAQGLYNNNWNDVPIIAVETTGTASFFASKKANKLVAIDKIEGVATSLGASMICKKAFEWTHNHTIHSVIVTDKQAINACSQFADEHKFLVEPACGASLAVAYESLAILENINTAIIIICGGVGVTMQKIFDWESTIQANN